MVNRDALMESSYTADWTLTTNYLIMKKFFQSKASAWAAFIFVLIYLVATFKMRMAWWMYMDVFFIFMAAFLNLVVCYIRNINRPVAQTLNNWALIFGLLFIAAFIGEWIAVYILF